MRSFWLLLLVPLVAGCLSDDASDASGSALADIALPDSLVLDYTGCREHMAVVAVPVLIMGDDLPPGFEPVTFDPAGELVQMLAIALTCELDGREASELMGAIAVTAPPEYTDEAAFAHAWLLGGWVSDAAALEAYESWGVDLMDMAEIDVTETATPAARFGNSRGGDSSFSVDIDTVVAGPVGVQPAGHARVFHAAGLANQTHPQAFTVSWNESATMQGEGQVRFSGLPPFATAGIGIHNWGDDYALRIESLSLPLLADS